MNAIYSPRAVTPADATKDRLVMEAALASADDRRLLQCFHCGKDFESLLRLDDTVACERCAALLRESEIADFAFEALFPDVPQAVCTICGSNRYDVVSDRIHLERPEAVCCERTAA